MPKSKPIRVPVEHEPGYALLLAARRVVAAAAAFQRSDPAKPGKEFKTALDELDASERALADAVAPFSHL